LHNGDNVKTLGLFGDSILDNAHYTQGEPDTTAHLQRLLPDWSVSLKAVDGSTMQDVPGQLAGIAPKISVAVISIGGNDAVQHIGLLNKPTVNSSETLDQLLEIADEFEAQYESAVRTVEEVSERTILCTIYEVPLEPERYAQLAKVPLALLNDRIVRIATRLGTDVLDLRGICTESTDFVLQIEPSATGARKIANAIADLVSEWGGLNSTRLFSG
jgi:hypothetical protein